ncbi:MAG TPA: flagellar assembly protein FliW [Alphaproteobacteria bacterium]|jgi:flagellar assembly factor FliW
MLANSAQTQTIAPPPVLAPEAEQRPLVVESRFGTLAIGEHAMLSMPQGLLGFGDYHDFALAELPEGKYPQFRVLQCLSDQNLAFLVAPLSADNQAIEPADIEEACRGLGIAMADLALMLIVTVRRDEDGAHVSVNLRAPVFVDTRQHFARQFVMPNSKYPVRHSL